MSDALRQMAADIGAGGRGLDSQLALVLAQLSGVKVLPLATGAGIAATTKARRDLSDASNPSLRCEARIGGQHGNNIRVKTIRQAELSAAGNALFTLEVYYPDNATLVERFSSVSMIDADERYVETVVNTGLRQEPASEYLRVTDLDSATGDQRPTDQGPSQINTTAGAGEVTLTGLKRGDYIAAVIDITTATAPTAIATTDMNAADTDKVVSTAGVAATHGLLFVVLPK